MSEKVEQFVAELLEQEPDPAGVDYGVLSGPRKTIGRCETCGKERWLVGFTNPADRFTSIQYCSNCGRQTRHEIRRVQDDESVQEQDVNQAIDKLLEQGDSGIHVLPIHCWALHPEEGTLVKITRGESGYERIEDENNEPLKLNQKTVDMMNQQKGVSPATAEVMFDGSMFGWDIPKVTNFKGEAVEEQDEPQAGDIDYGEPPKPVSEPDIVLSLEAMVQELVTSYIDWRAPARPDGTIRFSIIGADEDEVSDVWQAAREKWGDSDTGGRVGGYFHDPVGGGQSFSIYTLLQDRGELGAAPESVVEEEEPQWADADFGEPVKPYPFGIVIESSDLRKLLDHLGPEADRIITYLRDNTGEVTELLFTNQHDRAVIVNDLTLLKIDYRLDPPEDMVDSIEEQEEPQWADADFGMYGAGSFAYKDCRNMLRWVWQQIGPEYTMRWREVEQERTSGMIAMALLGNYKRWTKVLDVEHESELLSGLSSATQLAIAREVAEEIFNWPADDFTWPQSVLEQEEEPQWADADFGEEPRSGVSWIFIEPKNLAKLLDYLGPGARDFTHLTDLAGESTMLTFDSRSDRARIVDLLTSLKIDYHLDPREDMVDEVPVEEQEEPQWVDADFGKEPEVDVQLHTLEGEVRSILAGHGVHWRSIEKRPWTGGYGARVMVCLSSRHDRDWTGDILQQAYGADRVAVQTMAHNVLVLLEPQPEEAP